MFIFVFPVSLVRFSSPVPCFPLLCLVFLIISCISTVDRDTGVLATKLTSSCSTDTGFWRKALWSEMGANWSKFLNFTSNKQLDCHKFDRTGGFSNRTVIPTTHQKLLLEWVKQANIKFLELTFQKLRPQLYGQSVDYTQKPGPCRETNQFKWTLPFLPRRREKENGLVKIENKFKLLQILFLKSCQ